MKVKKVNWMMRISQVLVATALLFGILLATLYWLTGKLSWSGLRWWAWGATVALPLASGLAWYYGRSTAQAQMTGIQWGVNQVMGAAHKTADLRATGVGAVRREVRAAAAPPAGGVTIVQPVISPKALPTGNDVLEL